MTQKSPADYAFWRAALRGAKQDVQENSPQCGFYRIRQNKEAPWLPIAWWRNAVGQIVCGFRGETIDPLKFWTWAAKNPVEETVYRECVKNGGVWQDGSKSEEATERPRSNMPSDPLEALAAELADKLENAEKLLKTPSAEVTKTQADHARNLEAMLMKLNSRATELFEDEKAPALAETRRIDAKFGFRAHVKIVAGKMKAFYEGWQKFEHSRLQAVAQKEFEERHAAAAAKRQRQEEERKRLEADDPILAAISEPEPPVVIPAAPEPVKVPMVGGGFGNRAGLSTVYNGQIVDYRKCLEHFADDHRVVAVVEKLVKDIVKRDKQSTKIPGVEVHDNLGRKAA